MYQRQTSNFDPLLKISNIVRNPKKRGYSLLPVSRSTFLRDVAKGEYPKPVRIAGSQINYWRLTVNRVFIVLTVSTGHESQALE